MSTPANPVRTPEGTNDRPVDTSSSPGITLASSPSTGQAAPPIMSAGTGPTPAEGVTRIVDEFFARKSETFYGSLVLKLARTHRASVSGNVGAEVAGTRPVDPGITPDDALVIRKIDTHDPGARAQTAIDRTVAMVRQ